jgi:hypothetical protein
MVEGSSVAVAVVEWTGTLLLLEPGLISVVGLG